MNLFKTKRHFEKLTSSKKIHEAQLFITNSQGDFTYEKNYNRDLDTPMLMASITKMVTASVIYILLEEGKIKLEDKIIKYFPKGLLSGINIYKGIDYTDEITIENLLYQTSGLADYYLDNKGAIFKELLKGDYSFSFEDIIRWEKSLKSIRPPSTKDKAYYSDFNFDLLGKIIESVTNRPLSEIYQIYIFKPLNLKNTYLVTKEEDIIGRIYYKDDILYRPKFIMSSFSSGGVVTTANELMTFLRAFFKGDMFDSSYISADGKSNNLQMKFYPIEYMGGFMKIKTSYPFGKKYTLIGHSGSTGSFSFYCPEKDLFFVGDIPQIDSPSRCVRFIMRVALDI